MGQCLTRNHPSAFSGSRELSENGSSLLFDFGTPNLKGYSKNQLLIFRKYRTLSPNASVQHRTFLPTLHRGIPNPINRRQNT